MAMGCVSWSGGGGRGGGGVVLIFNILMTVRPSLLQAPPSLSLPVHMAVVPPPWDVLPLSQVDLGPLFSNSSPFSSSRSLFMLPPPSWSPRPGLRASFGPHSARQLLSEPVLPLSPPLSAFLLSEHVELDRAEDGEDRFRVWTMFHKWGDSSSRRTCVTLHAFKDTEETRTSCLTQPPLGLCVVTMTLPRRWFEDQSPNWSHQHIDQSNHSQRSHTRVNRRDGLRSGRRRTNFMSRRRWMSHSQRNSSEVDRDFLSARPRALRSPKGHMTNHIQLYYSTFDTSSGPDLMSSGCSEDHQAQSQRRLFYIKAVTLKQTEPSQSRGETCLDLQDKEKEEEELHLDPHVLIRYHRGPVLLGQPLKLSVNLRSNFSAEFVVIRLKVNKGLVHTVAQRILTSDLWSVTLERNQGPSHDVLSIVCHKHHDLQHSHDPTLPQQVVCLSVRAFRRSFDVAMATVATWWVEYSGHSNPSSPPGGTQSTFSFTDRRIVGIAPITESNKIINTAVLTNQPVSLSVIILAVGHDGKLSDVTSAVTCRSANENTLKVSSDCSALFVDGSESGQGNTCAVVEFLLGKLRGSVCLEVWAPSVPLRLSLSDPVLNAISDWNHFTEDRCSPVYQRTTFQVLTQFRAQDSGSRTVYLLSSDWFVDVTELVRDWLRVDDPEVVSLGPQNSLRGLKPGKTSVYVVSEQWDGVLGSCDITVTSDPVSPTDLSVQVVSGLGLSVTGSSSSSSIVTATVTAYNILSNLHQEASISVWLQFSDDSASLLSTFSDLPHFLRLSSLAESVVVVTPGPNQRIFAQGDGGGPLLQAELLISTCSHESITSNFISEGNPHWTGEGGGRMKRLARGSGWIRVNLDLGFLHPAGARAEEDENLYDVSDLFSGPETFDEDLGGNLSSDFFSSRRMKMGDRGLVSRNNLERAMLMPSQEDGSVYPSPDQDPEWDRIDRDQNGSLELEVGVGAVLSLLGLSTILFLANCLPCALRDRKRVEPAQEVRGEVEGGREEEHEDEMKTKMNPSEVSDRDEDEDTDINNKEEVKEIEIIC